ncbi:hypothetical protein [Psychrobacillus sp. FSL K6-1464]|uniref:hypothetical protein n=1 Tax=Psychrobacillus sp. FSL K6-1464 TaxID=2921545 RepID=UPI0030F5878B
MTYYNRAFRLIIKQNFMLLIISIVLLVVTLGFWVGIPVFVIGNILTKFNIPVFIHIVCISISVGLFFSLYFIPFHLKVAHLVGKMKNESTIKAFGRLQLVFVLLSATAFYVIINVVLVL